MTLIGEPGLCGDGGNRLPGSQQAASPIQSLDDAKGMRSHPDFTSKLAAETLAGISVTPREDVQASDGTGDVCPKGTTNLPAFTMVVYPWAAVAESLHDLV
jgi:hypothetical protein